MVNRIINAIRQDEEVITIPWVMGPLTFISKCLLPVHSQDIVLKYLCGWDMMSKFRGRQQQNAIFKTSGDKIEAQRK